MGPSNDRGQDDKVSQAIPRNSRLRRAIRIFGWKIIEREKWLSKAIDMFGFFLVAKLGDNKYDDIELTDEENEALQFMFRDKVMPYTNFDTSQMVLYHTDQLRLAADDQPGIPPVDGRTGKD